MRSSSFAKALHLFCNTFDPFWETLRIMKGIFGRCGHSGRMFSSGACRSIPIRTWPGRSWPGGGFSKKPGRSCPEGDERIREI